MTNGEKNTIVLEMEKSILIKPGVIFREFNKYTIEFLLALKHCCDKFGRSYTITSANDGTHSVNSLHQKNMAWDVRLNDLPKSHWQVLADNIKMNVGKYFDIVIEEFPDDPATDANESYQTHLHVEADLEKIASFILDQDSQDERIIRAIIEAIEKNTLGLRDKIMGAK